MSRPDFISDEKLLDLVDRALAEDIGDGDVTTLATVAAATGAEASFMAKADGVLAGQHVADLVLKRVDPNLDVAWMRGDGETIYRGTMFGTIHGSARSILMAERLTLNILQRMSGIATLTRRYVNAVRGHKAQILDTRKTAPGLRLIDKWAVRLGGGHNHRIGLFDMILIKDNHIAAAGGILEAIDRARRFRDESGRTGLKIEVEARTMDEVRAVLDDGSVDIVLLDNMVDVRAGHVDTSVLRSAVELIDGRIITEASGNVTLETVNPIASTGVDFISCGALTHSVEALDISLQMRLAT